MCIFLGNKTFVKCVSKSTALNVVLLLR